MYSVVTCLNACIFFFFCFASLGRKELHKYLFRRGKSLKFSSWRRRWFGILLVRLCVESKDPFVFCFVLFFAHVNPNENVFTSSPEIIPLKGKRRKSPGCFERGKLSILWVDLCLCSWPALQQRC